MTTCPDAQPITTRDIEEDNVSETFGDSGSDVVDTWLGIPRSRT